MVEERMRTVLALLGCLLAPSLIAADGEPALPATPADHVRIIGGTDVADGKWPDVAAILFPSPRGPVALCTGTLVAPTVVLTAAHCFDPDEPPLPESVLVGASSLAPSGGGETIPILRGSTFADLDGTHDVAVLVLSRPSTRAPRKIATGWARFEIANGAPVTLVGFGAIDRDGELFIDELQEARSTITDFNCSRSSGCNASAQPDGELGAGGMGIDTCPGDSGGPLYLMTSYGALLAGVTSRSYLGAAFACSDGGIYHRPDKVIDWIEATAEVNVARGPEPQADAIVAGIGDGGETRIEVHDPRSDSHRFEIEAQPAHGVARVRRDGAVRVCVDPAATPDTDELVVKIIDDKRSTRALSLAIAIDIQAGAAPATPCDLDAFDSGGCCDSGGGSAGALPLAIGVLALLRRRRR
jgi:uncharacterized protein (TIGR03382 family)